MVNFYTAMYHAFISPTVYMDVDGQYKGIDQNVHRGELDLHNYTTFSLWDTYRALHPLFNIIQPTRNRDMIRSMMAHHDQSVRAHAAGLVALRERELVHDRLSQRRRSIADAIVTGNLTGAEANKALDAAVQTAQTKYYDGLEYYMRLGYVPEDKNSSSVSKTLEYAYDDWAIAQAAKKLGRTDVYNEFIKRSENWKNVYDPSVGFMRPK